LFALVYSNDEISLTEKMYHKSPISKNYAITNSLITQQSLLTNGRTFMV